MGQQHLSQCEDGVFPSAWPFPLIQNNKNITDYIDAFQGHQQ